MHGSELVVGTSARQSSKSACEHLATTAHPCNPEKSSSHGGGSEHRRLYGTRHRSCASRCKFHRSSANHPLTRNQDFTRLYQFVEAAGEVPGGVGVRYAQFLDRVLDMGNLLTEAGHFDAEPIEEIRNCSQTAHQSKKRSRRAYCFLFISNHARKLCDKI